MYFYLLKVSLNKRPINSAAHIRGWRLLRIFIEDAVIVRRFYGAQKITV